MIKKKIESILLRYISQITPENVEIDASPICFKLAKSLKKSPHDIAKSLLTQLSEDDKILLTSSNGYLNITLTQPFIWNHLIDNHYLEKTFPKKTQKTILEFVSANPTGPLHVGHGRWAVIGDTLGRIMNYVGATTDTECYINDAGSQIDNLIQSTAAVRSGGQIPEDGYHGDYIIKLSKSDNDPVNTILNWQKETLKQLNVSFTKWFSERSLHEGTTIDLMLDELSKKNATYEKDGALWFETTKYGDDKDRVLRKSDGSLTYFCVDIAYHMNKLKRGYHKMINIWGADHHGYIGRMKAAICVLADLTIDEIDDTFTVIVGQLVTLLRGGEPVKMSKRSGEMITLNEVIDEIGVDATRIFMIQKSHDTHLDFDLDLAKKQSNENPVFYLQYAHARICSIKQKIENMEITERSLNRDLVPAERHLIITNIQFHDAVWHCNDTLHTHSLVAYGLELAKAFHTFYQKCPILSADKDDQNIRRLIVEQTQITLVELFKLLGIHAPENM